MVARGFDSYYYDSNHGSVGLQGYTMKVFEDLEFR